ncbi:MAG: DUF3352 domain-containing protein [Chloroflexota bacterium]|nr:DUF3352 domain-containing protein [Chloroflexota bacterium]
MKLTRNRSLLGMLVSLILFFALAIHVGAGGGQPMQPWELAQYFPADTQIYVSIRTDIGFLDQLDAFAATVTDILSTLDVPPLSVRDLIGMVGVAPEWLTWLGDAAAIGVITLDPAQVTGASIYAVIHLQDAASVYSLFSSLDFQGDESTLTSGSTTLQFIDDVLIVSNAESPIALPEDNGMWEESTHFQETTDALPADNYNALIYLDAPDLARLVSPAATAAEMISTVPPLALGLTILDGKTYAIDAVALAPDGISPAADSLSADFTRLIPASANAFMQAHDLSNLIEVGIQFQQQSIDSMQAQMSLFSAPMPLSTAVPPVGIRDGIVDGLRREAGIDFDADVLSWTSGDYALFARSETRPIAEALVRGEPANRVLEGRFDFAALAQVTDADSAARFIEKAERFMQQGIESGRFADVTVGREMIAAVEFVTFTTPLDFNSFVEGDELPLTLVMGAANDLFYFGTPGAVADALDGGESIADSDAYIAAQSVILSDPSVMLYTDDEGLVVGLTASPFGLVDLFITRPVIGTIFRNVLDDYHRDPSLTPSPTPTPTPSPVPDVDKVLAPLDKLIAAVAHSSISASVDAAGTTRLRIEFTLK